MSNTNGPIDQVWFDGALRLGDDVRLRYDDHGITVGDGIFETLKVSGGVAFAIRRHLERFENSARIMGIPVPPLEEVRTAIEAVAATTVDACFLRVTLTAGPGPLASSREELTPNLIVAARPGALRQDLTDVELVEWTRNERGALAGVKSTSYGENVVALAYATSRNATEAIFANTRGELCEGTGSNVFVGFGDRLLTPPLSSGCLAGVTRQLLLDHGVGVEETITLDQVLGATEMFLVSTGREVQPVARMSDQTFPAAPGPLTIAARQVWVTEIGTQVDP